MACCDGVEWAQEVPTFPSGYVGATRHPGIARQINGNSVFGTGGISVQSPVPCPKTASIGRSDGYRATHAMEPGRVSRRIAVARPTLRRSSLRGCANNTHLLPSRLPGAHARARSLRLLPISRARGACRLPPMPALSSGVGPRSRACRCDEATGVARGVQPASARPGPRGDPQVARPTSRMQRSTPSSCPARGVWRRAGRTPPDVAPADGEAAHHGHRPAHDAGRDDIRIRKREAIQRPLPVQVSAGAVRGQTKRARAERHDRAPGPRLGRPAHDACMRCLPFELSTALRLASAPRAPPHACHPRSRVCRRSDVPTNGAGERCDWLGER